MLTVFPFQKDRFYFSPKHLTIKLLMLLLPLFQATFIHSLPLFQATFIHSMPLFQATFKYKDSKIPIGSQQNYEFSYWGLLFNNIVEYDATKIDKVTPTDNVVPTVRYSANGRQLTAPKHGLNIIKYSDGSIRKVLVR